VPPAGSLFGRACLQSYLDAGFVHHEAGCSEEVSRTLNYWLSDSAIAGAAEVMGDHATAQVRCMEGLL
jgi:putative alpha-1,2-mannosidase